MQNSGFKVIKTMQSASLLSDKHLQHLHPKTCFCPSLTLLYSGKCWHDGSMMKWGEIRSCERQNPTVSYEQFLSDLGGPTQSTHRAWFIDTCTRCRAHTCCSKGGRICWNKCSQEKSCIIVDTQTWLWLMLSMCRRYIPCLNTVNCIWCKCFPNQACCLEQTCFLD